MRTSALLFTLGLALTCSAADVTLMEQIVAKVNGDIITRTDLERMKKVLPLQAESMGLKGPQVAEFIKDAEKNLLRDKIDDLLVVQRGKELSVNVDAEVSKYLGDLQKRFKIADPDKFQQWIRDNAGMTFEDFKQEKKNELVKRRVVGQEVYSKISIPKAEMQKFYEDNKASFVREEMVFLRELFVSIEGRDWAAAEKKAKDLAGRASRGERFTDLVRDNSDSTTAEEGGMLEPFKQGALDKALEEQVWDKPRGHVAGPIKISNGFLILRVEEHLKAGQASFEEAENDIRDRMFGPLAGPKFREFMAQLRMEAFLELRDGYIDSGAVAGKNTAWSDPAQLRPETVTKEEVASRSRIRRLLWMIPVPGTKTTEISTSSSR